MEHPLIPPGDARAARPFEVSDRKINMTALALGAVIVFAVYPAYELLRLMWGANQAPFSLTSMGVALACGAFFGWNARRRILSLARLDTSSEPREVQP